MVINGLIFKSDKIILFFEMKMFVFSCYLVGYVTIQR